MTVKVQRMVCQTQWRKFETSCYFVSTETKNWTESRQACIAEGADLVVINSHDEQVFVNSVLDVKQNAWMGLTDSLNEGVWMWLDGTPATTTYWEPGQPNSYSGDQDCGEFIQYSSEGHWNDDGCFADQNFICEK
ncbi:CD209 antigen-like protein E [Cololabis saira]|uniref:CD209 antigen-like protein E n=1 Tax=Cololabis saira TaxID=129043 RepID=UPI002AD3E11C|nr:CD209 antigen-like protein E [Cololabis saira]